MTDTAIKMPAMEASSHAYQHAAPLGGETLDLITWFRMAEHTARTTNVLPQEPMDPNDVAAIMAWATAPDGMDWALIERYEDGDAHDES